MTLVAEDTLEDQDVRDAAWGLALLDLAISYNSRPRQQREAVYFRDMLDVGPIMRPPPLWRRPMLTLADMVSPDLRLRHWRYTLAHRRIQSLSQKIGGG
jgi:hypothetical protein